MRIRQANKIIKAWCNYQYMNGRSIPMGGKVTKAVWTRYGRRRRLNKRLVSKAWIRQVKRLTEKAGRHPWMVDIKVDMGTLPTFEKNRPQPVDGLFTFTERFVIFAGMTLGIIPSQEPPA